jgi:hypothetical protein
MGRGLSRYLLSLPGYLYIALQVVVCGLGALRASWNLDRRQVDGLRPVLDFDQIR